MTSRLEVDSVHLEFGDRRILSGVYMLFETGKITGILGRNGAGKSCLLRIIFGSLKAQYSNVRYNGETLFSPYRYDDKIKYLPQFNIFPGFIKISKAISLFDSDPARVIADFPEFGPLLNLAFSKLSYGQKRLLETYLFLKAGSAFILLDEPFSYLMPIHVEKIKEIMKEEKKNKGIIITDHLYGDLMDVANSVYLIYDSTSRKIIADSELREYGYIK